MRNLLARSALALLTFGAIGALLPARAQMPPLVAVPKFESLVTDLTGTLTAEQQAVLEQKLSAVQARKGAQLALLFVPTTQPEDIAQYSIRVVDAWKLGSKLADDGVLLLVAKDDRTLRIEVGTGLEGALTDIASNRIINDTIRPLFRQNDFFGGINAGFDQITKVIDGEPLPPPDEQWQRQRQRQGSPDLLKFSPVLLILVVAGSALLRSILGRGIGSLATAGLAGFLVWIATQLLGISLLAGLFALLVSAFTGLGGGRLGGAGPFWWGGGFGGGSGGGGFGGGGGGFSGGGGGGFSGGGASGSW